MSASSDPSAVADRAAFRANGPSALELRIALIATAGVVCAVAIYAIYLLENEVKGHALAIVTGKNIEARLATASAGSVLALPPGSEIKVISTRGDWSCAALPNNLRGWIPANAAELVRL